ncbi:hypothetical protein AB5J62_24350 [Amycolatopsis sp. cg5]|uniref:terpene synthase family protein n=1 Tax=Amycolatopsis sp. cg5 TaxID=3238802 RepID=UPI00352642D0
MGDPERPSRVDAEESIVTSFTLAELECPFPSMPHPDQAAVENAVIDWMWKSGYLVSADDEQAVRNSGIGRLGAWAAPRADVNGAAMLGNWLVWLFLMDDEIVEPAAHSGELEVFAHHALHCRKALYGDPLPEDAGMHLEVLAELRAQLFRRASNELAVRITDGINDLMLALACEAIFQTNSSMPTLSAYSTIRESTVTMRAVCMAISSVVQNCELPGVLWARPEIQELERLACRIIGFTHDYYSGPRELERNDGSVNFIAVLMEDHRITAQEALDVLAQMNAAETHKFQRLAESIRQAGDEAVCDFVTVLERWIRGNYDWSRECGRYRLTDELASAE